MLKKHLLTLGRGLAMLAAVYVPAFALVSIALVSGIIGGGGEHSAQAAAVPLTIGISLVMALILIATAGAGGFQSYGFRSAGAKMLWWSLGLGITIGALLRLIATVLDVRQSPLQGFATWQVITYFWLGAPVQEEVIFRGLLQGTLEKGIPGFIPIGRWRISIAALVTAVVFAIVHLALLSVGASLGEAAFVVVGALILGLVAGQLRWKSESLIPCFVVHALFNIVAG